MKKGYVPEHFLPEELFSKRTIQSNTKNGIINGDIWRLIDSRVIRTADLLRKRYGTLYVNDYKFGGSRQFCGYRPAIELIDWKKYQRTGKVKTLFSSFTSQHCFGRALDIHPKNVTAKEIRQDIRDNPENETFKYITAIERGVNWLHFDVRNLYGNEILFF